MSRVIIRPVGQKGDKGDTGEGVPVGGTTGQILAKASNTDYDTEWTDNDPDGVQSVTGDGVGGTAEDVVLTFPTPAEIGAYPDSNPSNFIDASGAPVQSVNTQTGVVVLDLDDINDVTIASPTDGQVLRYDSGVWENDTLDAGDVGAIPTTDKGTANGVATLGADGVLVEDTEYVFKYIEGAYYKAGNTVAGNGTSSTVSSTLCFIYPMMIVSDIEIDRMAINIVSTGGSPSTIRMAIYKARIDSQTIDLVDGSDVLYDTEVPGVKIASVDCVLPKGLYYVAFGRPTGSGNMQYTAAINSVSDSFTYKEESRMFTLPNINTMRQSVNMTTGFPDTINISVTSSIADVAPLLYVRIKP